MTGAVEVGAVGGERKRPARSGADGFCWRRGGLEGVLGLTAEEGKRRGRTAMDCAFLLEEGGGDAAGFLSMDCASVPALRNRFGFEWARRFFGFFFVIYIFLNFFCYVYPILFSYI